MSRTPYRVIALAVTLTAPAGALAQTIWLMDTGPTTLGSLCGVPNILLLEVAAVDPREKVIVYKRVAGLKGKSDDELLRHNLSKSVGFIGRAPVEDIFRWAKPGRRAICFRGGDGRDRVCVGNFWYYAQRSSPRPQEWRWAGEALSLTTAYVGPVEKLHQHIKDILAGREVVVTAETGASMLENVRQGHGPFSRDWPRGEKGRVCRVKASLKITEPSAVALLDESRYFVGWGVGGPEVVPALVKFLKDPDSLVRTEAAIDLRQLGPVAKGAVPGLRQALKDPDRHVRLRAAAALARIDPAGKVGVSFLVKALKDKRPEERRGAAVVLGSLPAAERSTLPVLLAVLRKDDDGAVRRAAAFAVGQVGAETDLSKDRHAEAVAALARAFLKDSSPEARLQAARSLLYFSPDLKGARGAAAAIVRGEDYHLAGAALEVLARLGEPAVPAFCEVLKDRKCVIRGQVFYYLARLGPAGGPAVPALRKVVQDAKDPCRWNAAGVLPLLDRDADAAKVLPVLCAELKPHGPRIDQTLRALGKLGPRAAAAVPAIVEVLWYKRESDRVRAARTLEKIGPAAVEAVPALTAALQDESIDLRVAAARALCRIEDGNDAAMALLVTMLKERPGRRHLTAQVLGELGPSAWKALPALRAALDEEGSVRPWIAAALWRVGQPVEAGGVVRDYRQDALAVLLEELRSEKKSRRYWPVHQLGELHPPDRRVVAALMQTLNDKDADIRHEAAAALGKIGPMARAAIPALRKIMLNDEDLAMRRAAAEALCRIDGPSSEALAVLTTLTERAEGAPDIAALSRLGPRAKPAVPALLRSMRRRPDLFWDIRDALWRIDPEAAKRHGIP